jgi:hypothetical protein
MTYFKYNEDDDEVSMEDCIDVWSSGLDGELETSADDGDVD